MSINIYFLLFHRFQVSISGYICINIYIGPTAMLVVINISINKRTTLSNGYLGSRNDEERSEARYVMRIAEFSESSNL
jgi:hypothetical protein